MTLDPALDSTEPPPLLPMDLDPEEQQDDSSTSSVARATTLLAIGSIVSRLLGFAKEILLTSFFGPSRQVDALQIALTIPQDLYDLAISGHLNSALVPTLSEYAARNRRELWKLVSALLTIVMILTGGLVLILIAFAPLVIRFYRGVPSSAGLDLISSPAQYWHSCALHICEPGFTFEAFALSVQLLRITAPALLLLAMFAILSGTLYALRAFLWPAFAAAVFNGILALGILILVPRIGITGAAIGWVVGALAQLVLQFWGLRKVNIRPHLTALRNMFQHPGLRRIGLLYVPVLFSLGIDVLINRTFSYNLASRGGDGVISYMNWATRLREFPMGLVGTAVSLAILPTLARQALSLDELQNFKDTLGRGIRLALTLIIPATVGMFVLAGPLIGLLFERGAFTSHNTLITATTLRLYLLGIPFAAVDLLLIFAFYARKDSLTPALVGVFSLACYMGIALVLQPRIGFYSLMVADSLKHLIHMTISLALLRRLLGTLGKQNLIRVVAKILFASIIMGIFTYVVVRIIPEILPINNLRDRFILFAVPSLVGGGLYFLLASLLRLDEFQMFVQAVRNRLGR